MRLDGETAAASAAAADPGARVMPASIASQQLTAHYCSTIHPRRLPSIVSTCLPALSLRGSRDNTPRCCSMRSVPWQKIPSLHSILEPLLVLLHRLLQNILHTPHPFKSHSSLVLRCWYCSEHCATAPRLHMQQLAPPTLAASCTPANTSDALRHQ